MKIWIAVLLAFVWVLYGSFYAAHRFPPTEWWVIPTAFVVIAAGFVAIVAAGILVQYITDSR
jgi:RsiW-degrading membrane proteinase PrsW (M82 family)